MKNETYLKSLETTKKLQEKKFIRKMEETIKRVKAGNYDIVSQTLTGSLSALHQLIKISSEIDTIKEIQTNEIYREEIGAD